MTPFLHRHERDLPPAVIAVISVLIMAGVVALFLWVRQLDPGQRIFGRTVGLGPPRVLDAISDILDEPRKSILVGRVVRLDGERVQDAVGDALFWVGSRERRVAVLALGERMERQPESRVQVAAGDRVGVTGILLELHGAELFAEAELLTEAQRERLRGESVIIHALRVVVMPNGEAAVRDPQENSDRITEQ